MGSSFFGLPNTGNEKSSSSRKSKKSSSEKPKQPQRGLGVAQLEQIRLRSQMGCGFTTPSVIHSAIQEDMRVQGSVYGVPQSSTSYPYSQSSPSTSSSYGHHPNFMMVFGNERANIRYQDSQPSTAARWNPNGTGVLDSSTYTQAGMASRHLGSYFEDSRHQRINSISSSSQNSESNDHEDVDLELRLSI